MAGLLETGRGPALSRRRSPEFAKRCPSKDRGSRGYRVRAAPAVSCAKLCEKAHTSIQVQRKHSGIPRAMALRLMPCSSRRRIRLVTVVGGSRLIRPGWVDFASAQLDTSNGCRNHTVLPYALAPFVLRAGHRSRETRPATPPRADAKRVHRILAHVRDDARPPLLPGKDGASW
jgi:hypothetical protein